MSEAGQACAVLVSGGVDSCVLLAEMCRDYGRVHPLYVRSGLYWEEAERAHLERFLAALDRAGLQPVQTLELPAGDIYGQHWSVSGSDMPDAASPDEAVYLPGRNVLLLAKAMVWCRLHQVGHIALALLKGNPFPDATPEFFARFEQAVNQAIEGDIRIHCPYAGLSKLEVLQRGRDLPLELTCSCIHPEAGQQCGQCNKCGERRRAFAAAGMIDRTPYLVSDER
ncbi:MAG: 7-cyano-7-deazaguanine synthase [Gemmataceae bacterium]